MFKIMYIAMHIFVYMHTSNHVVQNSIYNTCTCVLEQEPISQKP